jgi:hypothetical protein
MRVPLEMDVDHVAHLGTWSPAELRRHRRMLGRMTRCWVAFPHARRRESCVVSGRREQTIAPTTVRIEPVAIHASTASSGG